MKHIPSGYRAIAEALLVVFVLVTGGALGYMLIEGWGFFDSLYMSVITLTTVGYLEVHPLSTQGRIFTMGLLLSGVFSLFYAATAAIRSIVGGELTGQFGRNRMEKKLVSLKDHIIVCGYGRMGRLVAQLNAAPTCSRTSRPSTEWRWPETPLMTTRFAAPASTAPRRW